MDAIIEVTAQFTRLPSAGVPSGASHFVGAVTIWPTKYAGGSDTGSAAIKVGSGRDQSVFGLYLDASAVKQFADVTEPEGLFDFELAVRGNDGAAEFSVVSVVPSDAKRADTTMSASIPTPVLSQVDGGRISALWNTESDSHLDIAAPAGLSWNPALANFVGGTLPALDVRFERRLVPGAVQNPASARALGGDDALFVAANPRIDLAALTA